MSEMTTGGRRMNCGCRVYFPSRAETVERARELEVVAAAMDEFLKELPQGDALSGMAIMGLIETEPRLLRFLRVLRIRQCPLHASAEKSLAALRAMASAAEAYMRYHEEKFYAGAETKPTGLWPEISRARDAISAAEDK